MKAFGRLYKGTEGETTVTAAFEFPSQVTASMLVTAEAGKGNLKQLNHVDYIGTKGHIVIRDLINNPGQIEINGEVVDASSDDGQMELYNWSNSAGLRYQVNEVRKCLMEDRITSSVHGPEKSILMVETITKLMNDIGSSLNGMTARDFEFKPL